jgi:hypothetical protein
VEIEIVEFHTDSNHHVNDQKAKGNERQDIKDNVSSRWNPQLLNLHPKQQKEGKKDSKEFPSTGPYASIQKVEALRSIATYVRIPGLPTNR